MAASLEIMRFESKFGVIETPWIPIDMLVEKLWQYTILYDDPKEYGALPDALAVLRPDIKRIVISDALNHPGRECWSAAHEGGHIVLHLPADAPSEQIKLFPDVENTPQPKAIYCRDKACGYAGSAESGVMYREAEFFAGCLLMPRGRYLPLAERRLTEALDAQLTVGRISLEAVESSVALREAVYTAAVESAVSEMAANDLNRSVSKQAQKIRLSGDELGLIHEMDETEEISPFRVYMRKRYEFSEHFAAQAAKALGFEFSPDWRGSSTLQLTADH